MARIFALLIAMIMLTEAAWYRIRGPTTVTSLKTVDGSYHLVTLTDVTFSGAGAGIRINVGDMMTTFGTLTPLSIQLCSCTFTGGASLYLYGRTSPASTAANSAPLTLIILGLVVNNAGIGFYGEMPYNSRISIVRPTYYINGGGSTYPQIPGGSHTSSGLLIASAGFRAGSFLFYGQPLSLTANTFAGGGGYGITFEGTTTIASGCMFHIFQLSSVNTYPIYGSGARITISGVSVFYIEEMEALHCTTCVTLGTIVLLSSSIFLLNKGNFAGDTGLVFTGSADGSNNWFGMMGNTFDVSSAVSSSFSGNYMSIFGNYYRSGWSQSASTCWAMCNSRGGNLVGSPASGCDGSDCTPGTLCAGSGYSKSQCYYTMAYLACASQKPACACTNAAATTEYCIPFAAPKIPTACVSTNSHEITTSITATLTELQTLTETSSASQSSTLTDEMSLSESKRSPTLSQSPSDYISLSFSDTSSWSATSSKSKQSASFNQSFTIGVTPTHRSITLSRSPTRDGSLSMSLSDSMSSEPSDSASPSVTPTQILTPSASKSETETYTETPTESETPSLTDSWCEWFKLEFTPVPPLLNVNGTNETMEVEYQHFRDYGANFIFDDLGQWWIKNYSWIGDPASNITLFTFNNLTVIIPKITEPDWHATNPIKVGLYLHPFPSGLYYNSELVRDILVGVTFRCAVVNYTSYWIVRVNAYHAIVSAAASQTAMRSAMLASVVLATPYGSAIAAMALNMQQLMLCQPLTDTDQFDVTGLEVGGDDKAKMRGAIIGNVCIVAGQFVLMMLVVLPALHWNKKIGDLTVSEDFFRILRVMQLPTSMHVSVSAVLQLIVAASVSLFRMSDAPQDIVLGVVGMLLCAGYTALIIYRSVRIYIDRRGSFVFPQSLKLPIRVLPKEEDQFLYGEYDKPWYAGFETFFLLAVGIICGSPTALPFDCSPQYLALAFISIVSIFVLLRYRPMATMAGQVLAILLRVVTIVLCAASIIMTRSRENQYQALDGAAISLLIITAFAFGRALYDLRRAYHGIPWLIRAIFRLKQPEPEPEPDLVPELDEFPIEPEPILHDDESSEDDYSPQDQLEAQEVVGFLGKASEEIETVDDLLMMFRKKKVKKAHHKGDVDLEAVLGGGAVSSSSSSSEGEPEEDVRRVVKKAPTSLAASGFTSSPYEDNDDDIIAPSDDDDDEGLPLYEEETLGGGGSSATSPKGGRGRDYDADYPLQHVRAPNATELHSASDESLQFVNQAEDHDRYQDMI